MYDTFYRQEFDDKFDVCLNSNDWKEEVQKEEEQTGITIWENRGNTYSKSSFTCKEINILIDKNKDLFKNLLINKEREMKTAVCSCFKREVKI